MPMLDRQAIPQRPRAPGRANPPSRVAEERPTPLQAHFIHLSAIALVAGTVAITAWELGQPLAAAFVRWPTLLAVAILVAVTADAATRIARSVGAWRAVDPGRAAFRSVWVAVLLLGLVLEAGAAWLVLSA